MKIKLDKANITMSISILLVCVILVSISFIQFKTVEQVNETDIENMRDEELREQISSWKSKWEEANEKLEDTNTKISEYQTKIESNEEASELLDEELKLYNDVRIKILENSANKDEDGVPIINESTLQYDISDDKLQIALEEIEELQDEDINIDIRKVTVEDINKAELTPRELMLIEFMLEV